MTGSARARAEAIRRKLERERDESANWLPHTRAWFDRAALLLAELDARTAALEDAWETLERARGIARHRETTAVGFREIADCADAALARLDGGREHTTEGETA